MNEPLFSNIPKQNEAMQNAYVQASSTLPEFIALCEAGPDAIYMAKLRFKDPGLSEKLNEDRFLFIWLADVYFHEEDGMFSGEFFELPEALTQWHSVGERIGFYPDDVFDWMMIDEGRAKGGFTIRAKRQELASDKERQAYDEYIGISAYEPA